MAKYRVTIPATSQSVLELDVDMEYDKIPEYIRQINNDNFFKYGNLGLKYTDFSYEDITINEIIADDEINKDLQELEDYFEE